MDSPLRGGIVGFGFIAERGHLPAYAAHPERFEIAAIADPCAARREHARRALPRARVYDRTATMLASEALDFVDIATPPSAHAAICHSALEHGLHVICEKPLATSEEEALAMLAHASHARRVLFPSHNYHHAPVIRAVRELLDGGALGEVHLVTLQTLRPTHARGVSEWLPDWRRDRRYAGGGIAMDHASHAFYLAFDWLGAYPTSVTAHLDHRAGLGTEDGFSCAATFPNGTAIAHLTWNAGVRKVIYSLHGARGALTIEDDAIQLALRDSGEVRRLTAGSDWMDASHAAWFSTLQAEFLDAIRTQQFVGRHAIDALQSVRWIETAYASARAGSRVLAIPPVPEPPWLARSLAG
ncbi:MAG TPA: Gfo/Idh/MocA family oxidoreductase [Kofleriaceae bacterium]|nr:Gfo/Idh/MocA family oxidoreductase [Kofleriaceae bacterium]